MQHTYSVEAAVEYGVNAAVILQNIYFWVQHNEANDVHFHDGHYWTYNSMKAFGQLFPEFTENQIRTALKKLVDGGAILVGNYNSVPYDRTTWYAVSENAKCMCEKTQMDVGKNPNPICEKTQMEAGKNPNGYGRKPEPIPDINTDINVTDIKPDSKQTDGAPTPRKSKEAKSKFGEYQNVQLTERERDKLLSEYGEEKSGEAIRFLDEYIEEKGYKSKSHYLAIRRWVITALGEKKRKKASSGGQLPGGGYDWDNL